MTAATISFYEIVVSIHVAAAIVAFGPIFAYGVIQVVAERSYRRNVPFVWRAFRFVDRVLVVPGATLVLLSGIYLVLDGPFDWSDGFVGVGLLVVLGVLVLAHVFFLPRERVLAELSETDISASGEGEVKLSEEYWKASTLYARIGSLSALLVLVAVFFMVVKPGVASGFFGVVANPDLTQRDFDLMRDGRVGSVRLVLPWLQIEPRDDRFRWGPIDEVVGNLAAGGIEVVPDFFGSTGFVSNDGLKPPIHSEAAKEEWREWLREAVGRYGPGGTYWTTVYPLEHLLALPLPVSRWQIWNEQNSKKHFHRGPNVGKYATLLEISHEAIKAVDPDAQILLGGMADSPSAIDPWEYLDRLYAIGGTAEWFDGVALHPYSENLRGMKRQISRSQEVLAQRDPAAQIWITELGWSSDPSVDSKLAKTPEKQAELLERSFGLLQARRDAWNVGGVFWFTWRDSEEGVCRWCNSAGLVDRDRNPKPAWQAFKRFTGGS